MTELDSLFVSGKEVDEGLLVKILQPFLRINQETASIVPNERWLESRNEIKVVVFLIARKAMKLRGMPIDSEGLSPAEIENETGIKGSSLRPILKSLFDRRIISKTPDGKYFVPSYSMAKIHSMINSSAEEK